MGLGADLEGTENLAHWRIRTPDRLSRIQSLYRLCQLDRQILYVWQGSTQGGGGVGLQPPSLK